MTWSDFYLFCFLVGFGLSVLALLAGTAHLHLPHLHLEHGLHVPHSAQSGCGPRGAGLSWFNFGTIAAFLAWFGGTGYLLEHYYDVWFVLALGVAMLSGIGAASVVFWFLAKVLMAREAGARPGRLRNGRRAGQVEHPHPRRRHRRVGLFAGRYAARSGARSEDGAAIPKGVEVMVTRYEKGIAYVRPWQDPAEELELKQ